MGKVQNDRFCKIPYRKFVNQLFEKAENVGIGVVEIREDYTSKCDALAGEAIKRQMVYSGKRVKRGLFRSGVGRTINSDVNGAINIMRRYFYRYSNELCEALMLLIGRSHRFIASPIKQKILHKIGFKFGQYVPSAYSVTGACPPVDGVEDSNISTMTSIASTESTNLQGHESISEFLEGDTFPLGSPLL